MSHLDVVEDDVGLQPTGGTPSEPRSSAPNEAQCCETRYIDEAALAPLARTEHSIDTPFLAAEISAARTAEERIRMMRSILHIIGFTGLGYAALKVDADGDPEHAYVLRDYLASDLLPKALEGGYFLRDSHMRRAFDSSRLHVWDTRSLVDASRREGSHAALRRHFDAMRAGGLASGLAFSLPISRTPLRALMLFAGAPEHCEWLTDSVVAQAIALGLSLHQRCSAHVQALHRGESANALSELQQRILSAVAIGMPDKAIAALLNTTVHNIDYHLRQLREKLEAKNRSQLAFLAGKMQAR